MGVLAGFVGKWVGVGGTAVGVATRVGVLVVVGEAIGVGKTMVAVGRLVPVAVSVGG
jgi:hypothetical protein